jgi:hypothetical protein
MWIRREKGNEKYTENFGRETSWCTFNLTSWKAEVKMGVREIVRADGTWMEVAQDRVQ